MSSPQRTGQGSEIVLIHITEFTPRGQPTPLATMSTSLDELRMKAEPCTLLERIQSALENLGGSSNNKRPQEETSLEAGDQPAKKTRPSFATVTRVRIIFHK